MIILSRGDVTFLANLYAFGVIWSFVLNGIAVLVLRYKQPEGREFRVPLNFRIAGHEIPAGVALITLVLFLIALVNLFTKNPPQRWRELPSPDFFSDFTIREENPEEAG